MLQKTRAGDKEDVEITMNSSIPYPQKKTEPSDEREHGNGAERMNTKDSSPEEQTESLLQSWFASILCYCTLLFWLQEKEHRCPKVCNFQAFLAFFIGLGFVFFFLVQLEVFILLFVQTCYFFFMVLLSCSGILLQ